MAAERSPSMPTVMAISRCIFLPLIIARGPILSYYNGNIVAASLPVIMAI
jgi:hypothetical protein